MGRVKRIEMSTENRREHFMHRAEGTGRGQFQNPVGARALEERLTRRTIDREGGNPCYK